jgi:hypothetical protein
MRSISAVCLCGLVLSSAVAAQGWPQWGGPHRNFMVDAPSVAAGNVSDHRKIVALDLK